MVSESLFKADLEALRGKAYDAVVRTAMYPRWGFRQYWEFVTKTLEEARNRTQSDFYTDRYKEYTGQVWIKAFEGWLNDASEEETEILNLKEKVLQETGESATKPNDELLTDLQTQINDALLKDSQNRAELVLDFMKEKGDEILASFGEEATDLIVEIVRGLKEEEAARLGVPKPVSAPAQVIEKTDEEAIDELDFLDDDIDEVFSLEELEEELDLDDLNLD